MALASFMTTVRPPATASSSALVGRLNSSALRALCDGDFLAGELRIVHALEIHEIAAVIDDGDEHVPVVLDRLLFGGGGDSLGGGQRESLLIGEHVAQCSNLPLITLRSGDRALKFRLRFY